MAGAEFTWFAHSDFLYINGWTDRLSRDVLGRTKASWFAASKTADYGDWTPPWYYHMHAVIQVRGVTKSELVFVNDHPAMELRY